jgi:hypothetical protein
MAGKNTILALTSLIFSLQLLLPHPTISLFSALFCGHFRQSIVWSRGLRVRRHGCLFVRDLLLTEVHSYIWE